MKNQRSTRQKFFVLIVCDIDASVSFKTENESALAHLEQHLGHLDSLPWEERQEALVRGLLAGNVFDWGAKEVVSLMEEGLSFRAAGERLQSKHTSINIIPGLDSDSLTRTSLFDRGF